MEQRTRAAAYIRVSTTSRFQCHSYEFQVEALKKELQAKQDAELIAVYADKGISGKAMRNRMHFKAMMHAALNGEIDIIYCKSVSRFARNTTELLTATRELREMGVAVYFETEKINTLDTQSELYLIIAAAVAENELTVFGARNEWAVEDNFKQGKIYYGNGVYGYKIDKENRTLIVDPQKAETVKYIFNKYAEGHSAGEIARELNKAGVLTLKGGLWQDSSILYILKNEKYIGECLLRKTYSEKGVKKKNLGEKEQYLIENSHEAIIDKELFERVQRIREHKPNMKFKCRAQTEYPFSGIIECGSCGKKYTHKVNNAGTPSASNVWCCGTQLKQGRDACLESTSIKDEVLKKLFIEAYNEFINCGYSKIVDESLTERKQALLKEERELLRLRTKGLISQTDYTKELNGLLAEITSIDKAVLKKKPQNINAGECQTISEFDESKLDKFIQKITIKNYEATFVFVNNIIIKKPYTNGKHGDIRDWIKANGHPSRLRKEAKKIGNGSNK
jgi:site-specific DNA recombinase